MRARRNHALGSRIGFGAHGSEFGVLFAGKNQQALDTAPDEFFISSSGDGRQPAGAGKRRRQQQWQGSHDD